MNTWAVQVARQELAQAFANGMDFLSTYGGCTAAGVAGLATLAVLRVSAFLTEQQGHVAD